ncbi:hypothetical protein R1flu_025735 [Riccia fluitans]|uniref:Core-2/I-branching beta-1,6-N-acetylglucosaminyltransferase family protein n=1 Tax=Riccia fluitans TaxID=41844 RepID=A0ABD1XZI2_9MARC
MKTWRAHHWFDIASAIPLVAILSFSLFVVWHFLTEPSYSLGFSIFRTDASSSLLGSADQPLKIDQVTSAFQEDKCCRCALDEEKREKSRRVSPLLHGFSDTELLKRAIEMETATSIRYFAKLDCIHSDIAETKNRKNAGSRVPCPDSCGRESTTARVKIAFIFMITTSLPFEALWNKYFQGKGGRYNIYVHADPFNATLFADRSSVFFGRLIPSAKADRGSPSLVMASQRLLANAMLDDPLNQYFALLSGSCIPIRSFDYGYQKITSSKKSFLEMIIFEPVMEERYRGREGGAVTMLPEIPFDKFRKGAHWFVFIRRHALMMLKDQYENKYWAKFDRPCIVHFCGTDEHYYHTLFNILEPEGVTGKTVTHVVWPSWPTEHPIMYQSWDIKKELIEDMRNKDDGHYLFARKFHEDTAESLLALADLILQ